MKNMNSLQYHIDELVTYIERLSTANYIMTPKVCPTCHRLRVDQEELIHMYHTNECYRCDHIRSDK